MSRATRHLLSLQSPEGWWKGELETNVTMDAEDLLLRAFLGMLDPEVLRPSANWIRSQQRDDGTWANFWQGPGDLSTGVEAYAALRLAGDPADAEHMRRAREWILDQGGLERTRVFTRMWMALFGIWPWDELPALPPEMVFFPHWFPLNPYDFGCWARQTIVPLTVVSAWKPVRRLPFDLAELRSGAPAVPRHDLRSWEGRFERFDAALRAYERHPHRGLRRAALRRATEWILRRQEADGSWGGIQPPWVYSMIALDLMGFGADHPVLRAALAGLDRFTIVEPDRDLRRLEACQSPVWDTCLAVTGLADAGLPRDHPALLRAADWMLGEEIRVPGDWGVRRPHLEPGGWAFEFANDTYPDIDDTAEVILALRRVDHPDRDRLDAAVQRGVRWTLGMQSSDGGWGAFDADNTRDLCRRIPFCDFGEVIDPPSADVTAHVVEMLAGEGLAGVAGARRGLGWLGRNQEPGRLVVRAVGRQPRLRDGRGRARGGRRRCVSRGRPDPPRGWLAPRAAEPGRRVGRGHALVPGPGLGGARHEHGVPDVVGAPGPPGGRRARRRRRGPRRRVAGANPAPIRNVERARVHGDRLPRPLLHQLSPVPAGLSAAGARQVRVRMEAG